MRFDNLNTAKKNMSTITDNTCNGVCSECGECCTNLLPMTQHEINQIRKYIKTHHIKPCKHILPLSVENAAHCIDTLCPFLDTDKPKEKCRIYAVRPNICKCFLCSAPNGITNYQTITDEPRRLIDVHMTFFPNK